jgi:NAD-dependent deacetylase
MADLIDRAARDIARSSYAVALTGAGISTESGIADFRGPSGVWTKNPEAEALAYRSYPEFTRDPKIWWEKQLSGKTHDPLGSLEHAQPNAGHLALVELEKVGILKTTITQNIDALHEKAGCAHLLEFHGSRSKLRCLACNARCRPDMFDLKKLQKEDRLPPRCLECNEPLKSDVVFFGEPIPADVAEESYAEALKCDLMLIAGTSAAVYPFANLPRVARERGAVKIIEVNAEPTPLTQEGVSDYLIQCKTGEILPAIVDLVVRSKSPK